MTRKYMNNRWCVRCGKETPTPYLKNNIELLEAGRKELQIVDLGCGNGRNSRFMESRDHSLFSIDMAGDYGERVVLGHDELPVDPSIIGIVLCNYIMMFLDKKERNQLIEEIKRIADDDCTIIFELYPALDSHAPTKEEMIVLQREVFNALGWQKIRYSQGRFIAKNVV